jgi:gliding motility-associated-like protein
VCQADADVVHIDIVQPAIVSAGGNASICEGSSLTLVSAFASNYISLLWTSSGSGTFSDPTVMNPTYYPSFSDIINGTVSLLLTAAGNVPCPNVSDQMILTISRSPLVYAGDDATICGNSSYTVPDATAEFTSSYLWTTTGAGSLSGSTSLTPTYSPAPGETGEVMLILTGIANAPCINTTDTLLIQILSEPIVSAGPDTTICANGSCQVTGSSAINSSVIEWITSGTGVFNNSGIINPVYTPSPNDIDDGFVFLTVFATGNSACPTATDVMKLSIARSPFADAGPDATVCQSSVFSISQATAQNYTSVSWTTNGLGILTGENTLTPSYQPVSNESGTVTLTLIVSGNAACNPVTDQMLLFIHQATSANAGPDLASCELSPVPVSAASVINSSSILWTTNGNGTFNNPTLVNPVYTPGSLDAASGMVQLTLYAEATSPCPDVSDQLILTINKAPQAYAGPDVVVCTGTSYTINQATASNYSTLQWSVSPASAGIITESGTLTPTFTPSAGFSGNASLILRVQGYATCSDIVMSSQMNIYVNASLVADAGPDQEVYNGMATTLSGSASGGSGFYAWSWQPDNLLINPSVEEPVTIPLNAPVTFTLTVMDLSTGCLDTDEVSITIGSGGSSVVAIADYDTTLVNTAVTVNVLGNDIYPAGEPMIVSLCGFPSHGIVVVNSDKTITYTPYSEFEGDDFFCYRICNANQQSLCSDTMVYIHVKLPSLDDLVVYNGVSPNGDGNNDTWKIKGIENYPDNTVMIFNRWGDKIREFSNYNNTSRTWEGKNENGELLPDGTYFYIIDVKNVGVLKGWIYLREGGK